jgi:hypothetical protein
MDGQAGRHDFGQSRFGSVTASAVCPAILQIFSMGESCSSVLFDLMFQIAKKLKQYLCSNISQAIC